MIFRHLLNMRSHPTWVRELKLCAADINSGMFASHPTWVRELKPSLCLLSGMCRRRTLRGCVN